MGKIGLALAGGGARGAYQVGAWKALKEAGYNHVFDMYSGASVGSLNASLFAMEDYDLAERVWLNLDKTSLFNIEKNIMKRLFKEKLNFFNKGIYNTKKLEKLMNNTIDYDKVRNHKVFVATTYLGEKRSSFFDLIRTNYEHYFVKDHSMIKYKNLSELDNEAIKKTILASCAIPVAFQPITIDGDTFYDGGLLDNTPITPLKEAGASKILVIDLFRVNFRRLLDKDEDVYYLHPSKGLRGVLDFDPKQIQRRFDLGYKDMKAFLEEHPDFFEEK
jgi:NTE family protein